MITRRNLLKAFGLSALAASLKADVLDAIVEPLAGELVEPLHCWGTHYVWTLLFQESETKQIALPDGSSRIEIFKLAAGAKSEVDRLAFELNDYAEPVSTLKFAVGRPAYDILKFHLNSRACFEWHAGPNGNIYSETPLECRCELERGGAYMALAGHAVIPEKWPKRWAGSLFL